MLLVNENPVALKILYRIVKMFYVSNQLFLSAFYKNDNSKLEPWMTIFKAILDL